MAETIRSVVVDILHYTQAIDTNNENWHVELVEDPEHHNSGGNNRYRVMPARTRSEAKDAVKKLAKMGFHGPAESRDISSIWVCVYKKPGGVFS